MKSEGSCSHSLMTLINDKIELSVLMYHLSNKNRRIFAEKQKKNRNLD